MRDCFAPLRRLFLPIRAWRFSRFARFLSMTATSRRPAAFRLSVQQIKDRVAAGDGLLLVTPEYNNSIPGVFKNVIDWMSRPAADIGRVFGDRPVAVMGATPGMGGTTLAQAAWLPVLRTLQMRPWFGGRLLVSGARQAFDAQGNLIDEKVRGQLKTFVGGF